MHTPAVVAIALGLLAASPAVALSCMRPDLTTSFSAADTAPGTFVMGVGRITLADDEAASPPVSDTPFAEADLRGWFSGRLSTASGFDHPVDLPLALRVTCAGPWCGQVPEDEVLVFLERPIQGGFRLTLGPCPQFVLPATGRIEDQALACLTGDCPG